MLLSNWRPWALFNVDYKIATKAIAKRLEKDLPKVINQDQTGFVKGRYIGQNIRLLLNVLEKTNKHRNYREFYFSLILEVHLIR